MNTTAGRVLAACALASLLAGPAPVSAAPRPGGSSPAAALPINVPPVPLPDAYTGIHDAKLRVDEPGVLANDIDADGDELEAELVTGTAHGQLNLHHDGSFVYEPDAGFTGIDGFTYAADDGTIGVPAAVVLTVTNTRPVANDDSYSTKEGTRLTVGRPGVLKNDDDADGDTLLTKLVDGPNHGSLTLEDRGKIDYIPDDGFVGTDSFTYRASDGADLSAPAKVTIDVTAGPNPTPTPPPTPTAPPSPTPTPDPTPTPPPTPSPTEPPTPTPTPVRTDNPTSTPAPTPTTPPDRTPDPTVRPEPSASPTLDPFPIGHDPGAPGSQGGTAPGPGGGPDGGSRGADGQPGQGSITHAGTPTGRDFGLGRPAASDMSNASIAFDASVDMAFDGFSWQVPALVLSVPGLLVVVAVFLQVVGGLAWVPVIRRRLGGDGLTPPDRRP